MRENSSLSLAFQHFTHRAAKWIGSGAGFFSGFIAIIAGFLIGDYYAFSQAWENGFAIFIGIITFLMIFVLQRSQNKELAALHLKLNELIVATHQADNSVIIAENLTEEELFEAHASHKTKTDIN